jgi:predicted dehydrogenase
LFVKRPASWLTPTVINIAQAIHDERAFDRMPVLADALEEAGCREEAILRHCRLESYCDVREVGNAKVWNGGFMTPHVRGCHVIDLVIGVLGKPDRIHAYPRHSGKQADSLLDNMLAVLEYPKATATVKSSAEEVDGGSRRHFVVCGTSGTFHIQPLDSPAIRLTLDRDRGNYKKGTQEIALPKFTRYVADAADMARILRGEKETDFPYAHDLTVQQTVLAASGVPVG